MNIVMWKTGSIKLDNVVLKLIVLKKINIMNMGEKKIYTWVATKNSKKRASPIKESSKFLMTYVLELSFKTICIIVFILNMDVVVVTCFTCRNSS